MGGRKIEDWRQSLRLSTLDAQERSADDGKCPSGTGRCNSGVGDLNPREGSGEGRARRRTRGETLADDGKCPSGAGRCTQASER